MFPIILVHQISCGCANNSVLMTFQSR